MANSQYLISLLIMLFLEQYSVGVNHDYDANLNLNTPKVWSSGVEDDIYYFDSQASDMMQVGRYVDALGYLGMVVDAVESRFNATPSDHNMLTVKESRLKRAALCDKINHKLCSIADYRRLVQLYPDSYVLWLALGQREFADEAVACLRKAQSLQSAADDDGGGQEHPPLSPAQVWHTIGSREIIRGNVQEVEEAFEEALKLDPHDDKIYLEWGRMLLNAGHFKHAITKLLSCSTPRPTLTQYEGAECNHYLGVAYHGTGQLRAAVRHYDIAMDIVPERRKLDTFYLHQLAFYHHRYLDKPMDHYVIDQVMGSNFLDGWSRSLSNDMYEPVFSGPDAYTPTYDFQPGISDATFTSNEAYIQLKQSISEFRKFYHYDTPGFFKNSRAQTTHGLLVLDLFQRLSLLRMKKKSPLSFNMKNRVLNIGASGNCDGGFNVGIHEHRKQLSRCSAGSGKGKGKERFHAFGWRDLFDIAVKYRMIATISDTVTWCDTTTALLDFSDGDAGYGDTLFTQGEIENYKYTVYFQRAFDLLKKKSGLNKDISTLEELMRVVGTTEHYIDLKLIVSTNGNGNQNGIRKHKLDGSRLIVVPSTVENGYTFSIRTYRDPERLKKYNLALTALWGEFLTLEDEENGENEKCIDIATKIYYLWVNMMPLNRGTAGVGMSTLQAMWLSCGVKINGQLPPRVQLDWEALLRENIDEFVAFVKDTLAPISTSIAVETDSSSASASTSPSVLVRVQIGSLRKLLEFLNFCDKID